MRTSRRRSSRPTRKVTIRRGSISGPGFKATMYKGGDPALRGRIAVERGSGMVEFPSTSQLPRILREEGIAASAAEQAFGRGKLKANGDPESRPTYGPRRMKLAHLGAHGIVLGTKRGSLILVDTRVGLKPVWGVIEDPPKTLRNMLTNRAVSLDSVFDKAKALKIPPQAVYDAFGHLMNATEKKILIATFHGMSLARR
jgi:hypothetical protein